MQPLPINSNAFYRADFLDKEDADALFAEIRSGFDITNRVIKLADGSEHTSPVGTYLFADPALTSFDALPEVWGGRSAWTDSLALVRDRIAAETGVRFQVGRCVYYKDGTDAMAFHQDLPAYGNTSNIASLSLGAERTFAMRSLPAPDEIITLKLAAGSLLFMGEGCQEQYEHGLLPDESCDQPRLNITFRQYGWD